MTDTEHDGMAHFEKVIAKAFEEAQAPGMTAEEFYNHIRETVKTVDDAKEWMARWYASGQKEPPCTLRAMSKHLSNILEGNGWQSLTGYLCCVNAFDSYYDTKYGCDLFYSDYYKYEEEGR